MNAPPAADATTHSPIHTINLNIHIMKESGLSHPGWSVTGESGYTASVRRAQLLRI
jgi:hypothetical protein